MLIAGCWLGMVSHRNFLFPFLSLGVPRERDTYMAWPIVDHPSARRRRVDFDFAFSLVGGRQCSDSLYLSGDDLAYGQAKPFVLRTFSSNLEFIDTITPSFHLEGCLALLLLS